jgi:hypothetical protein
VRSHGKRNWGKIKVSDKDERRLALREQLGADLAEFGGEELVD